jgi:hypothetical protein
MPASDTESRGSRNSRGSKTVTFRNAVNYKENIEPINEEES